MIQNTSASAPLNGTKKKNKSTMKILEWPTQSLGLNLIEVLWHDRKQAVHAALSKTLQCDWIKTELKQFKVKHLLPFIIDAWLQFFFPRAAQPIIRFMGQLLFLLWLFHLGYASLDNLFLLKINQNLKTAFCIDSDYVCY